MQVPSFRIDPKLHLLRHPFYRAWMEGRLPRAALQDYAGQYYSHVEAFPGYLRSAMSVCDGEARAVLAENLAEEDGSRYGTSHPELWLRFAEGVGVDRESVQRARLGKGIRNLVNTFSELSSASFPQAIGALYAYESQVPEVAHSKIEGLKTHFGIQDERSLAFFEVHKTADVAHRQSLLQLIEALPGPEQAEAQKAADRACRALWDFLTDVCPEGLCA